MHLDNIMNNSNEFLKLEIERLVNCVPVIKPLTILTIIK